MASRDKQPSKPSSSRTGGICTLSDLNHPSAYSYGPQEYYTGGEKSGMLIQDPSKANDVDAIFNQARQLGAVEWPVEQLCPSSSSSNFIGTGRLLSGETVQAGVPFKLTVDTRLYIVASFYVHWVTINPGISSGFLSLFYIFGDISIQTIRKSECPRELEPADRRSSVHVNLIRSVNLIRRNDNCPEPERHHVPGSWNFVINSVSSGTNDQMDMEDSMVEDTVQASTPIAPIFGSPPVSPPQSGSVFGSATPPAANPFQFAQQSSGTPQNLSPFQATNSLGGSFSVGDGWDKSGRNIVRVNRNKSRKK